MIFWGATADGLTNKEISLLLNQYDIKDVSPGITKADRLFNALYTRQQTDKCANNVPDKFDFRRHELIRVLAFAGLTLTEQGKLEGEKRVTMLSEAQKRADKLLSILSERKIHPDELKFCKA